ncbi:hypothetical protein [Streptomyces noursei]|uniref:Uncharacterized protein n=1 Tax=Streptomyces noursei TaxID=1971 RepID=A0A2N8PR42_STRNR|nr:hypothetical protein [Streptomyces noursei]PNE43506.1 hypothetical protein AOB60_00940 [Streptomyces noursei]
MGLPLINVRVDARPEGDAHYWYEGYQVFHVANPRERNSEFVMKGVMIRLWDGGPIGIAWAECAWDEAAATAIQLANEMRPWAASASAIKRERPLASRLAEVRKELDSADGPIDEGSVRGTVPDDVVDAYIATSTQYRPGYPITRPHEVDFHGLLQAECRRLDEQVEEARRSVDATLPDMSALPAKPSRWWMDWDAPSHTWDRENWGDTLARRLAKTWARVSHSRDPLFRWCLSDDGMERAELHRITGVARSTIDRIAPPR